MKYITLLTVVVLMLSCGTTQQKNKEQFINDGKLCETILGDFNGDGKAESAELYRLSKNDVSTDNIYFTNDSIRSIDSSVIEYTAMYLTNEGDLNDDGADDIGFFLHCGQSYWGTYAVYSYVGGEWKLLLSYDHNPGWNNTPIQDLVRKHPTKANCVIIKEISLDLSEMQERVIDLSSQTTL